MRTSIILIALAIHCGCASVVIKRHVYDDSGRELATVNVEHPATTPASAAQLMKGAMDFQATIQSGNAEKRVITVAEKSIDKGQPTSVATSGGQVQSGFGYGYGYGYGGYDPWDPYGYGYGQSGYGGAYDPILHSLGVDPRTVRIEQMWRRMYPMK